MLQIIAIAMSTLLMSASVVSIQQEIEPRINYYRGMHRSAELNQGVQREDIKMEFARSLQEDIIEDDCGSPYLQRSEESNECSCKPGFSGYNCTMCETDIACESVAPFFISADDDEKTLTGTCEKEAMYRYNHDTKTYDCVLDESLATMLPGIGLGVLCDKKQGDCSVAFYKENNFPIIDPFVVTCRAKGCTFVDGSPSIACEEINCKCSDSCDEFTIELSENMSNKTVEFEVDEDGGIFLNIPKMQIPIKAQCNNIVSCAFKNVWSLSDDDAVIFATTSNGEDDVSEVIFGQSLSMLTVAGIFLIVLLSLSVLIIIVSLFSSFVILNSDSYSDQPIPEAQLVASNNGDDKSMINTNHTSSYSIRSFEWENISCCIDMKGAPVEENAPSSLRDSITSASANQKKILQRVSGKAECGSVIGILGPSGSGKSTLLNALYGVPDGNSTISGKILVDGKQYHSSDLKNICAYVQQDDCLFPNLTVRECIEYSALLRLPSNLSLFEKLEKVEKVIHELHLEEVSNNRIGSSISTSTGFCGASQHSRVSGGERKRVSIGMELVTSPQILFLDEPTSGLDSYTSYSILKTLKELASHGRIVLLSIHQPNAKTFNMLDQVLLLYKGKLMYSSFSCNAVREFAQYGFTCPKNENIADFMMDTISDHNSRAQFIQAKFNTTEDVLSQDIYTDDEQLSFDAQEKMASSDDFNGEVLSTCSRLAKEFPILLQRSARNIARDRSLFVMHVGVSLILGLCGGYVFNNVEDNLAGFQNRTGAFYFMLTFYGLVSFSQMDAFISERRIFEKETGARYYSVSSYYFAKTALDVVVLRIVPILIFGCIFYWIMGLQATFPCFIIFITTLLCFNIAAGSISICISAFSSSVGSANLIATVIFLVMLLFGGFLVNITTLPVVIGWIKYVSIFNYGFEILITNELENTVLSFDAPGYPSIPVSGTVFLQSLNVYVENQMVDLLALCITIVLLNVLTYTQLRWRVSKG